jgi:O-antigen/teichoic acid export membrane protein
VGAADMSGPQTPSLAITSLLVRTASGNAGVRGIAMALGLLLALAISRNTEVAVFGQYFWLLAVIELTGRVSGLGFNASLTRYLVTYRRAGDWPLATGVLRFALAVVPVTGALAGVVVVAVVGFWEGLPQHALSSTAVAALITLFVLYPLMQILLGALQGRADASPPGHRRRRRYRRSRHVVVGAAGAAGRGSQQ